MKKVLDYGYLEKLIEVAEAAKGTPDARGD